MDEPRLEVGIYVPVRREAFEAQRLLGQVPIEASKDGADAYRSWRASAGRPP